MYVPEDIDLEDNWMSHYALIISIILAFMIGIALFAVATYGFFMLLQ